MANAHVQALNSRHAVIDGQIAMEMLRPLPDTTRLTKLKREKLKVKEAIVREG